MPSSMPHLILAHEYHPLAASLFFIGNLAPDSVAERSLKDKLHLRNAACRETALAQLARRTDPSHAFEEGVLLHLFFDWKWDMGPGADFMNQHSGQSFGDYRKEIGALSACLFHHCEWSGLLWDNMLAVKRMEYPPMQDYLFAEIHGMIERNRTWHKENAGISPTFYSINAILRLISDVKNEYVCWRKVNCYGQDLA